VLTSWSDQSSINHISTGDRQMGLLSGTKSTQAKFDDVQKRLATVQAELDGLNLGTAPTADLEAEEAAALKRLARREALTRVSTALSAELAELRAKLAQEAEEERKRQAVKLQADIDAAKAKATEEVWAAFEAVQAWKQLAGQMEQFKPGYGVHGSHAEQVASKLESALVGGLGAATVTNDVRTGRREVVRVKA
jgi:hypothetical protein